MKKIVVIVSLFLLCITEANAQGKSSLTGLNPLLAHSMNLEAKTTDVKLWLRFDVNGLDQAASVTATIGSTATSPDGESAVFTVEKLNGAYFLVQGNSKFKFEGQSGELSFLLPGKMESYFNKYVIVVITDKEGHSSAPQSAQVH